MSYRVVIPKSVQKEIDKLPDLIADSVIERTLLFRENPRPIGCIKLRASEGWRLRIGDYRIIYDINDDEKVVVLRRVGHRREVYR